MLFKICDLTRICLVRKRSVCVCVCVPFFFSFVVIGNCLFESAILSENNFTGTKLCIWICVRVSVCVCVYYSKAIKTNAGYFFHSLSFSLMNDPNQFYLFIMPLILKWIYIVSLHLNGLKHCFLLSHWKKFELIRTVMHFHTSQTQNLKQSENEIATPKMYVLKLIWQLFWNVKRWYS